MFLVSGVFECLCVGVCVGVWVGVSVFGLRIYL